MLKMARDEEGFAIRDFRGVAPVTFSVKELKEWRGKNLCFYFESEDGRFFKNNLVERRVEEIFKKKKKSVDSVL